MRENFNEPLRHTSLDLIEHLNCAQERFLQQSRIVQVIQKTPTHDQLLNVLDVQHTPEGIVITVT